MRKKQFLAAILLVMVLCFVVSGVGYGEVKYSWDEIKVSAMDYTLLYRMVKVIMVNPTKFGDVRFYYDRDGSYRKQLKFPADVDTKGKILVVVTDSRDKVFSKSGTGLLEQFKRNLNNLYTYIEDIATDMDSDIVAKFYSKGDIPLGYFYQGEYHLWEE